MRRGPGALAYTGACVRKVAGRGKAWSSHVRRGWTVPPIPLAVLSNLIIWESVQKAEPAALALTSTQSSDSVRRFGASFTQSKVSDYYLLNVVASIYSSQMSQPHSLLWTIRHSNQQSVSYSWAPCGSENAAAVSHCSRRYHTPRQPISSPALTAHLKAGPCRGLRGVTGLRKV